MFVFARCGALDAAKFRPERPRRNGEGGKVVVTCEFCSSVYEFTPQQAGVE
jgi:molecular chaperone Hsp33